MKTNIILSIIFLSFLFYGSVDYSHGIVGVTKLNGDGCVCHNLTPDQNVQVWIEGPDSVEVNQTVAYTVYLTGGPAAAGGYNAAALTGFLLPGDASSKKIDGELTHTTPKIFSGDTISWQFTYSAPSSAQWDTLYSVAQSVNNDGIPNNLDKWNFSSNFPVKVVPFVPVELTSFTAAAEGNSVILYWSTASETNNSGFAIERKNINETIWENLAFIEGNNTTTQQSDYIYTDNAPLKGSSVYRLKQIDYSGEYSYSLAVEVNVTLSLEQFALQQNYPNPFNPVTRINYTIPDLGNEVKVSLKIFDISGKEITVLVDEEKTAGIYSVEFNAAALSSGIYLYSLQAGQFAQTRKLVLLK